jgi:hypothetical protein
MKNLSVLCIALCVRVLTTAAFARGGMGAHGMGSSHMAMTGMSMTGGAFGTTAAAPAPTRWARRSRHPALSVR